MFLAVGNVGQDAQKRTITLFSTPVLATWYCLSAMRYRSLGCHVSHSQRHSPQMPHCTYSTINFASNMRESQCVICKQKLYPSSSQSQFFFLHYFKCKCIRVTSWSCMLHATGFHSNLTTCHYMLVTTVFFIQCISLF